MLGSGVGVIGTRGTFPRFNPCSARPPTRQRRPQELVPSSRSFTGRSRQRDRPRRDSAMARQRERTKNDFTLAWRRLGNIGGTRTVKSRSVHGRLARRQVKLRECHDSAYLIVSFLGRKRCKDIYVPLCSSLYSATSQRLILRRIDGDNAHDDNVDDNDALVRNGS